MEVDDQRALAVTYVQRNGTLLQRARMEAIAFGTPPDEQALALLFANWNPDGGWHDAESDLALDGLHVPYPPSSLSHTLRALRYASELRYAWEAGHMMPPQVRSGLLWVCRQQHEDGSFADDDSVLSGRLQIVRLSRADEKAVAFLTASALQTLDTWLAGVPGMEGKRERAFEWLRTHITSWHGQHPRTDWLVAAAALRREGSYSAHVLRPLAQLAIRQSEFPRELTATELAEMITTLTEAGWLITESPVSCGLTKLLRLQRADGAFAQPGEDAVEATIASLRALAQVGQPTRVRL